MQAIARFAFPLDGDPYLWSEDWRAARTANKAVANTRTNAAYDLAVIRSMLRSLANATEVRQVKEVVDHALGQADEQQLVMQYCAISAKLAGSLETTLVSIFDRLSLRNDPGEYNIFRCEWAMLQEAVARAMGLTVKGTAKRRIRRDNCRDQVHAIARLIRQGLALIRMADTRIAWQAIKIGAGRVW